MPSLNVAKRDSKKNADAVRAEGFVPAVFYGKSEEATPISIARGDFERTWHEAGESTIVSLEVDDGETVDTLIHDVQQDPVTSAPIHVDFFAFERGKAIEVNVPLEFTGEAPVVKEQGGILVKVIHDLPIQALPKDLPQNIEVDVSSLTDFESQLQAGDISLPNGVELAVEAEEVIVNIDVPSEEPEEPAEEEMSIDDIEVEGEKDESEEGEGEAGAEESE